MIGQVTQRAASAPRERPTSLSRLVFFLPLGGYWLLALVTAFHPRPLWVVAILGPPLLLVAMAVVRKLADRARDGDDDVQGARGRVSGGASGTRGGSSRHR